MSFTPPPPQRIPVISKNDAKKIIKELSSHKDIAWEDMPITVQEHLRQAYLKKAKKYESKSRDQVMRMVGDNYGIKFKIEDEGN